MKRFFRIIMLIFIAILITSLFYGCNYTSTPPDTETQPLVETTTKEVEVFSNYVVTAELVNIRKEPNTDSEILTSYYKNTLISSTPTDDENWNKIKFSDSSIAYVYANYISPISDDNFVLYQNYQIIDNQKKYGVLSCSDYGNIRALPDVTSDIVAVYRKNDTIEILGTTKNNWYVMDYNGITCYISCDIVKELSKFEYENYNKKVTKGSFDENNCTLIGTYSTDYSFSNKNRKYNLEKAATQMNNMLIEPLAMFNWCRDMGPCGKDEGYLESIEILNGKYVKGYGGGICQLSSTLCATVINSQTDFTFIDRNKHSITQSYIPSQLDATVSYPDCNFIFRNDNPYKVLITTNCTNGILTVNIYKVGNIII